MKITFLLPIITTCFATLCPAVTVQTGIGFNVGVNLMNSYDSTLIQSGYQFAIGTFVTEPEADTSFAQLISDFREFTRATVAPSIEGGKITAPGTGAIAVSIPAAIAPTFNAKIAYIIVGNGATLEMSTQYGVLKGTVPWLFPADTTGAASFNVIASNADAITAVIGTEIDNATGADSMRLGILPEPSTVLLVITSLVFALRRNRSKKG